MNFIRKNMQWLIIGIVILGIISFMFINANITTKQQTARINAISKKVTALYTKDRLNLNELTTATQIIEVEKLIKNEQGLSLTENQASLLNKAIIELSTAEQMLTLKDEVSNVLDAEGVVKAGIDVYALETKIMVFSDKVKFVEEMMNTVEKAKEQVRTIDLAREKIRALMNEDLTGIVEGVTRDALNEVNTLLESVSQNEAREEILALTTIVNEQLTAKEEELRKIAEAETEAKRLAEAKSASSSKQSSTGSKSNSSSSSSQSSSTQPESSEKKYDNAYNNAWLDSLKPGDSWTGVKTGEGKIANENSGATYESFMAIPNQ